VVIDGGEFFMEPSQLATEEGRNALRQSCTDSGVAIDVRIQDLPGWPDKCRFHLLKLLHEVGSKVRLFLDGNAKPYSGVFDATIDAMDDDTDMVRCKQGRRGAIEAACLFHPTELDEACSRIANRLTKLHVKGFPVAAIRKEAGQLRGALEGESAGVLKRFRDVFPEAPVPEAAVVPWGWEVSAQGIRNRRGENVSELAAPVVISARLVNTTEGTESVQISWLSDQGWQRDIVTRGVIADTRKIVNLADFGLPVTSINALAMVDFLASFENENRSVLPTARVSSQMGWHGHDKDGFLWGTTLITAQGEQTSVDLEQIENSTGEYVIFRGADEGDDQLAQGYRAQGSYEEWRKSVAEVAPYPRVLLAFYASFVPPMLTLLRAPNFVVDLCGETTHGKTTTQRIAASVWGNCDERSPSAAIGTWDTTRVHRERMSVTTNNMPLILDDTKRARFPAEIAQTVYDTTSGRGRGRGSLKGTQKSGTFTTVLISSGEAPITSFTEDGGSRARVLSLWGSPFGGRDPQIADLVNRVNLGVRGHYGHAGPRFVRFLLQNKDKWDQWQNDYQELVTSYSSAAPEHQFGSRMATYFAAITLTAQLVHEALDLPWSFTDPIQPVWAELLQEAAEADRASQALHHVMDWAYAHQGDFGEPAAYGVKQPPDGWAGRWDRDQQNGNEKLMFFRSKLKSILENAGFEYEPTIRTWKDRGWLQTDSEGKPRYKIRFGGESVWVVAITGNAIESLKTEKQLSEPVEEEISIEEVNELILNFWAFRLNRPQRLPLPPAGDSGCSPGGP
jgi:hypothetical protein